MILVVFSGYETIDGSCASEDSSKLLAYRDNSCLSSNGHESLAIVYPDVYVYPVPYCNSTDFEIVSLRSPDQCVVLQELQENNGTWFYAEANVTRGVMGYYYGDDEDEARSLAGSVKWVASSGVDDEFSFTGKQVGYLCR